MCPVCWATMLATVSGWMGGGIVLAVWRDWPGLLAAMLLLVLAGVELMTPVLVPWWVFAVVMGGLVGRGGWIVARHPERLPLGGWRRRGAVAAEPSATPCPHCQD